MPIRRPAVLLSVLALVAGALVGCAPAAPTVIQVPKDAATITEAADRIAPGDSSSSSRAPIPRPS